MLRYLKIMLTNLFLEFVYKYLKISFGQYPKVIRQLKEAAIIGEGNSKSNNDTLIFLGIENLKRLRSGECIKPLFNLSPIMIACSKSLGLRAHRLIIVLLIKR